MKPANPTPSPSRPKVLFCDDDPVFQLAVKHALKGRYEFHSAHDSAEALILARKQSFAAALLDIQMKAEDEGLRLIPKLRENDPELAIIMSTSLRDFGAIRAAMASGANDYVPKDTDPEELAFAIDRALERRELIRRQAQQRFETSQGQRRRGALIGKSPAIGALRRTIEKVRASEMNVVITGETGTGKEVIARQLRRVLADGSYEPFVAVDSATIQNSMAESLLFGHEKGAFTGADKTVRGIFEEADGGTAYFDEIANMPLDIQAKLLRVLQEKEIMRLGSGKVISLRFRVVCATNQDLDAMAAKGLFKADLLQRLNVIPLQIPALRDRADDIPLLVEHFCERNGGGKRLRFTSAAIEALESYSWPGNVRELENLVSYIAVMAESEEVDISDLPPKLRDAARSREKAAPGSPGKSFYDQVEDFERALLEAEYAKSSGNVSQMALRLGMDRSHLHNKLKHYGLHSKTRGPGDR